MLQNLIGKLKSIIIGDESDAETKSGPFVKLKAVFVGDSATGKTQLICSYMREGFTYQHVPTLGIDFRIIPVNHEGKEVKIMLWDTAGQERFRTIVSSYYTGMHAAVFVFDVTQESTLEHIDSKWAPEAARFLQPNVPKILVGNKIDLVETRKVEYATALQFAIDHGMTYVEVSAKSETRTTEMVQLILEKISTGNEYALGEEVLTKFAGKGSNCD